MSDRIAVMNGGVIEQIGTSEEIYHRPKTRFVADFIGETNLFTGQVVAQNGSGLTVETPVLRLVAPAIAEISAGTVVHVSIRPEAIRVTNGAAVAGGRDAPDGGEFGSGNYLAGLLMEKIFIGSATRLVVQVGDGQLVTVQTYNGDSYGLKQGSQVTLTWAPEDSAVMSA